MDRSPEEKKAGDRAPPRHAKLAFSVRNALVVVCPVVFALFVASLCAWSWIKLRYKGNPCGMTFSMPVFSRVPMCTVLPAWLTSPSLGIGLPGAFTGGCSDASTALSSDVGGIQGSKGDKQGSNRSSRQSNDEKRGGSWVPVIGKSRLAYKYGLYRFTNGFSPSSSAGSTGSNGGAASTAEPAAHPILFVPGHGGSYKQVRSLAAAISSLFPRVQSYTIDFGEEQTAVVGYTLWDQSEFVLDAVQAIARNMVQEEGDASGGGSAHDEDDGGANAQNNATLSAARFSLPAPVCGMKSVRADGAASGGGDIAIPKDVTLIGHSMGGIVARGAAVMERARRKTLCSSVLSPTKTRDRASSGPLHSSAMARIDGVISSIVTLGTPHSRPPVLIDRAMARFYREVNDNWSEAAAENTPPIAASLNDAADAVWNSTRESLSSARLASRPRRRRRFSISRFLKRAVNATLSAVWSGDNSASALDQRKKQLSLSGPLSSLINTIRELLLAGDHDFGEIEREEEDVEAQAALKTVEQQVALAYSSDSDGVSESFGEAEGEGGPPAFSASCIPAVCLPDFLFPLLPSVSHPALTAHDGPPRPNFSLANRLARSYLPASSRHLPFSLKDIMLLSVSSGEVDTQIWEPTTRLDAFYIPFHDLQRLNHHSTATTRRLTRLFFDPGSAIIAADEDTPASVGPAFKAAKTAEGALNVGAEIPGSGPFATSALMSLQRQQGKASDGRRTTPAPPWDWMTTTNLPCVGFGIDHHALLWCEQLVTGLSTAFASVLVNCYTDAAPGGQGQPQQRQRPLIRATSRCDATTRLHLFRSIFTHRHLQLEVLQRQQQGSHPPSIDTVSGASARRGFEVRQSDDPLNGDRRRRRGSRARITPLHGFSTDLSAQAAKGFASPELNSVASPGGPKKEDVVILRSLQAKKKALADPDALPAANGVSTISNRTSESVSVFRLLISPSSALAEMKQWMLEPSLSELLLKHMAVADTSSPFAVPRALGTGDHLSQSLLLAPEGPLGSIKGLVASLWGDHLGPLLSSFVPHLVYLTLGLNPLHALAGLEMSPSGYIAACLVRYAPVIMSWCSTIVCFAISSHLMRAATSLVASSRRSVARDINSALGAPLLSLATEPFFTSLVWSLSPHAHFKAALLPVSFLSRLLQKVITACVTTTISATVETEKVVRATKRRVSDIGGHYLQPSSQAQSPASADASANANAARQRKRRLYSIGAYLLHLRQSTLDRMALALFLSAISFLWWQLNDEPLPLLPLSVCYVLALAFVAILVVVFRVVSILTHALSMGIIRTAALVSLIFVAIFRFVCRIVRPGRCCAKQRDAQQAPPRWKSRQRCCFPCCCLFRRRSGGTALGKAGFCRIFCALTLLVSVVAIISASQHAVLLHGVVMWNEKMASAHRSAVLPPGVLGSRKSSDTTDSILNPGGRAGASLSSVSPATGTFPGTKALYKTGMGPFPDSGPSAFSWSKAFDLGVAMDLLPTSLHEHALGFYDVHLRKKIKRAFLLSCKTVADALHTVVLTGRGKNLQGTDTGTGAWAGTLKAIREQLQQQLERSEEEERLVLEQKTSDSLQRRLQETTDVEQHRREEKLLDAAGDAREDREAARGWFQEAAAATKDTSSLKDRKAGQARRVGAATIPIVAVNQPSSFSEISEEVGVKTDVEEDSNVLLSASEVNPFLSAWLAPARMVALLALVALLAAILSGVLAVLLPTWDALAAALKDGNDPFLSIQHAERQEARRAQRLEERRLREQRSTTQRDSGSPLEATRPRADSLAAALTEHRPQRGHRRSSATSVAAAPHGFVDVNWDAVEAAFGGPGSITESKIFRVGQRLLPLSVLRALLFSASAAKLLFSPSQDGAESISPPSSPGVQATAPLSHEDVSKIVIKAAASSLSRMRSATEVQPGLEPLLELEIEKANWPSLLPSELPSPSPLRRSASVPDSLQDAVEAIAPPAARSQEAGRKRARAYSDHADPAAAASRVPTLDAARDAQSLRINTRGPLSLSLAASQHETPSSLSVVTPSFSSSSNSSAVIAGSVGAPSAPQLVGSSPLHREVGGVILPRPGMIRSSSRAAALSSLLSVTEPAAQAGQLPPPPPPPPSLKEAISSSLVRRPSPPFSAPPSGPSRRFNNQGDDKASVLSGSSLQSLKSRDRIAADIEEQDKRVGGEASVDASDEDEEKDGDSMSITTAGSGSLVSSSSRPQDRGGELDSSGLPPVSRRGNLLRTAGLMSALLGRDATQATDARPVDLHADRLQASPVRHLYRLLLLGKWGRKDGEEIPVGGIPLHWALPSPWSLIFAPHFFGKARRSGILGAPVALMLPLVLLVVVGPTWVGSLMHLSAIVLEPLRAETSHAFMSAAHYLLLAVPLAALPLVLFCGISPLYADFTLAAPSPLSPLAAPSGLLFSLLHRWDSKKVPMSLLQRAAVSPQRGPRLSTSSAPHQEDRAGQEAFDAPGGETPSSPPATLAASDNDAAARLFSKKKGFVGCRRCVLVENTRPTGGEECWSFQCDCWSREGEGSSRVPSASLVLPAFSAIAAVERNACVPFGRALCQVLFPGDGGAAGARELPGTESASGSDASEGNGPLPSCLLSTAFASEDNDQGPLSPYLLVLAAVLHRGESQSPDSTNALPEVNVLLRSASADSRHLRALASLATDVWLRKTVRFACDVCSDSGATKAAGRILAIYRHLLATALHFGPLPYPSAASAGNCSSVTASCLVVVASRASFVSARAVDALLEGTLALSGAGSSPGRSADGGRRGRASSFWDEDYWTSSSLGASAFSGADFWRRLREDIVPLTLSFFAKGLWLLLWKLFCFLFADLFYRHCLRASALYAFSAVRQAMLEWLGLDDEEAESERSGAATRPSSSAACDPLRLPRRYAFCAVSTSLTAWALIVSSLSAVYRLQTLLPALCLLLIGVGIMVTSDQKVETQKEERSALREG